MGISNDWQVIDGLSYVTLNSNARFMDELSCQKLAAVIGWEVVHFADYTASVSINGQTYDTTNIYLIRPVAEAGDTAYNCAISPFFYQSLSNWWAGDAVFELSTGRYLGLIYNAVSSVITRCSLLRPTAQGGFVLLGGNKYRFFDKFFNPKSGLTKWGGFSSSTFFDLYTGLTMSNHYTPFTITTFSFGGFVSLKKFTWIYTEGVYNASTLYQYVINYTSIDKTIELGGIKYVNCDNGRIFVRLAE